MIRTLLIVVALSVAASLALAVAAPDAVYEVAISGMTCKGCAKEVKDLVVKIADVKTVEIDVKAGLATITMNGSAKLDRAAVETALKGSKFAVTSFSEKKSPESKPKG
jgi:copper chaperone CopZ